MRGSVKINNFDIGDLGMFILRGGDNDFLCLPERITPQQNNWYEQNGLDVDLSEIYFKGRVLSIHFYIRATTAREYEYNLNEFVRLVASGSVELWSREFARTFTLRYLDNTEYNHKGGLYKEGDKRGWVKIDFALDNPLQLFTDSTILQPKRFGSFLATEITALVADMGEFIDIGNVDVMAYRHSHVELNGIDLGRFGIIVNECYSSMLKLPTVKKPLTRTFARMSGTIAYPSQKPTFEAKELRIRCTMVADTLAEFYWNYEALFNNLAKTEALQVDTYLGRANCYYSKMADFKKHGTFKQRVVVSFTLHLVQIDVGTTYYVIGSAADTAVLTDNNEFIIYQN